MSPQGEPIVVAATDAPGSRKATARRDAMSAAASIVRDWRILLHPDTVRERIDAQIRARPWLLAAGVPAVVFLAAFALRAAFIGRSYDVLSDEVTYLQVSKDLLGGAGLTLHGTPFFLHPPLFFVIEGLADLLNPGKRIIDQVENIRFLNAALAGCTAVTLYAIANRVAGWRAGLVACALFALDPFMIRINSRNLLETSAFLWVALGYLVLLSAIHRARSSPTNGWRAWRRPVGAGLLFGCALLSKDLTAFLVIVPLGIAFLAGWCLPRRESFVTVVTAVGTYALYPLAIFIAGLGPEFVDQKLHGLVRFLGIVKSTGFVASGGPSFALAVTRNLDVFATTYALIGLGIPACALLLARGDPPRRLIALLGLSAYAMLAYSVGFGTLEEQFFYYLVLPALLTVCVAWRFVVDGMPVGRGSSRVEQEGRPPGPSLPALVALVAPVSLAIAVAWSTLVWLEVHVTPDDGYAQMLAYMRRNVPNGTSIGVTTEPQQFVLQGYVIVDLASLGPLEGNRVLYAAVSSKQVEDRYIRNGELIYAWLRAHAQPVFVFDGRTYGKLILFQMPSLPASAMVPQPSAHALGPPAAS